MPLIKDKGYSYVLYSLSIKVGDRIETGGFSWRRMPIF